MLVSATAALASASDNHFGAQFTEAQTVTLADAMANPDALDGKTVHIRAKVADVCQKEGCWLVLTDGDHQMRVMMKGHSFAVPKDLGGKTVTVEGAVIKKVISEGQAKHLAEESKEKVDPSTIAGDQTVIQMTATGVRIDE